MQQELAHTSQLEMSGHGVENGFTYAGHPPGEEIIYMDGLKLCNMSDTFDIIIAVI